MHELILFGSSFSRAALGLHVRRTTASAASRIIPMDEPDHPVPCFGCWALVGGGALYVAICFFRLLASWITG